MEMHLQSQIDDNCSISTIRRKILFPTLLQCLVLSQSADMPFGEQLLSNQCFHTAYGVTVVVKW